MAVYVLVLAAGGRRRSVEKNISLLPPSFLLPYINIVVFCVRSICGKTGTGKSFKQGGGEGKNDTGRSGMEYKLKICTQRRRRRRRRGDPLELLVWFPFSPVEVGGGNVILLLFGESSSLHKASLPSYVYYLLTEGESITCSPVSPPPPPMQHSGTY